MACDSADSIAAIVSLAGATWDDPGQCAPSSDVSVLQIHGTNDQTILYGGGTLYPSANDSTAMWAGYDGCGTSTTQAATNLDLEVSLDGAETVVQSFDGCPANVGVELWSIEDGSHLPNVTDAFRTAVWEWLAAHPKQ
jgi:polyhydroxybutyrate depolymerase